MRKLNKIFSSSPKIDIDKKSKIVIMSDCHRGEWSIKILFKK